MSIADRLIDTARARPPDFVIGGSDDPYLLRWYMLPRNLIGNAYLHLFLRSDDDRALHDHMYANVSILLRGEYTEHRILQGGINTRKVWRAGDWIFRHSGAIAHRIEIHAGPCWSLFLCGPRYREWGFHCPERGWIHWKEFTAAHDSGTIGRGCDQ